MSNLESSLEQLLREESPVGWLRLCVEIADELRRTRATLPEKLMTHFFVIESEVDDLLLRASDSRLSEDNLMTRNEAARAYATSEASEVNAVAEELLRLIRGAQGS